jgi:hypothetical protein
LSLKERDNTIAFLRAELQLEESATKALKHNLDNLASQSILNNGLPASTVEAIISAMGDRITLREGVTLLSLLYPDRLVILESAWKSADDAEKFTERCANRFKFFIVPIRPVQRTI